MNDRDIANLLGETPGGPDPAFRIDVFARTALRARRRASLRRALTYAGIFASTGAVFPLAHAYGATLDHAGPWVVAAVALATTAAVFASQPAGGVIAALTRARAVLRPLRI